MFFGVLPCLFPQRVIEPSLLMKATPVLRPTSRVCRVPQGNTEQTADRTPIGSPKKLDIHLAAPYSGIHRGL